jgi:starch synthase
MKVLFAASELAPLATSGGLGDAVAGLAHALTRLGVAVTVLIPKYQLLGEIGEAGPGEGGARALYRHHLGDLTVLLVDDPEAFDRPGIYGPEPGTPYQDEWLRWGRFSRVAVSLSGRFDVVHLHDAHPAAAAIASQAPTVLTLHNAAYPVLGPLDESKALLGTEDDSLDWYGQANLLKAGVVTADQVTTVSREYARQITRDPEVSSGLNEYLAALSRPLVGINNGIDVASFNPATDEALPATYSAEDVSGRHAARPALLARTGLEPSPFLLGMVGRMSDQKGLGLIDEVLAELLDDGAGLVLVGNGDLDETVDGWVEAHPGRVWHGSYDPALARLVWAGVDAYLMPSRFEPGGLGNLYAMRYGAPPIVRHTGGLAAAVVEADDETGNGFSFVNYESGELLAAVRRAAAVHRDNPARWARIQQAGMRGDWSWDPPAERYLEVYHSLVG